MGKVVRIVLLVINIPIYYWIFIKSFNSKEEFIRAMKYYLQPDLISVAQGEMLEDMKFSRKIGMCLMYCVAIFFFEDMLVSKVFGVLGLGY